MVSTKILVVRFLFFLTSELCKFLAVTLALFHLPIRLLRSRTNSSSPISRPQVYLTTHQPAPSYTKPRDTVVLIHGFPDSSSLWHSTVTGLTAEGYRCITVDLPGSKGQPIPHILRPADIIAMITDALKSVCDTPFTLTGHDWGSFYSSLLVKSQPQLIHRLVLLDVGKLSPHSDTHWTVWACLISYQTTLALIFMLGEPCKHLHRWFVTMFKYRGRPMNEVTLDMSYHYVGMLLDRLKKAFSKQREEHAPSPVKSIPLLFVYGRKKLFNFHDSAFVEEVRSTPCGEVVPLPCSHWIMVDLPDQWLQVLTDWLQKSETAIPQET